MDPRIHRSCSRAAYYWPLQPASGAAAYWAVSNTPAKAGPSFHFHTHQLPAYFTGSFLLRTDTASHPQGFRSVYKPQRAGRVSFADLLDAVAAVSPELRVRFTSPHPKEFSDEVLQVSLLGVVGQLYGALQLPWLWP